MMIQAPCSELVILQISCKSLVLIFLSLEPYIKKKQGKLAVLNEKWLDNEYVDHSWTYIDKEGTRILDKNNPS